jgi:inositol transport system substrate-binding protein
MKKTLAGASITALLSTAAIASSASAAEIGVTMFGYEDNFVMLLRQSMEERAAQTETELQFADAQKDIGRQLDQVQNFIAQGVDAIVVNPVDSNSTEAITAAASAAGVPLIYVNRSPRGEMPEGVVFVGSNEKESGTLQTQEVCRLLGGTGEILVMIGALDDEAARIRTEDVEDVVATDECKGIEIVDKQVGGWLRNSGADLMTNWISAGIVPDAVVANNDEMALGAIIALQNAGIERGVGDDKVIVAGIDGTPDALAAMQQGDLAVTVFQNARAQGAGSIDAALKLVGGEKLESNQWIPFELITPENMGDYLGLN